MPVEDPVSRTLPASVVRAIAAAAAPAARWSPESVRVLTVHAEDAIRSRAARAYVCARADGRVTVRGVDVSREEHAAQIAYSALLEQRIRALCAQLHAAGLTPEPGPSAVEVSG